MYIIWIFIGIVLIVEVWHVRREKYIWNNGICSDSNEPWVYFDTDSQGGRGYKDNSGNICWMTWGWDK